MNTDALRRAARTFIQGAVGVLVLLAVPILSTMVQSAAGGGEIVIDLNAWRTILLAVIAGGVIALISFIQNTIEDKTGVEIISKSSSNTASNTDLGERVRRV